MKSIVVRQKKKEDSIEEIADVVNAAFLDLQRRSGLQEDLSSREVCLLCASDESCHCFLAVDGSRIVGASWITGSDDPFSRGIGPVAVLPTERGRGIGRQLMNAVIGSAPDSLLYLTVDAHNIDAMSLYLSLGFRAVSQPTLVVTLSPEKCVSSGICTPSSALCRRIEDADVTRCSRLMESIAGFSRPSAISRSVGARRGCWMTTTEEAFCTGVSILDFAVGSNEASLISVLSCAVQEVMSLDPKDRQPMVVNVPIGRQELLKWALARGRIEKSVFLMGKSSPKKEAPQVPANGSPFATYIHSVEF